MISLKDKVVFITGSSSGIGWSCAELFADAGARIILTARRLVKLKELSNIIKEKYNGETIFFSMDVRDRNNIEEVMNSLPDEWKNIDILLNNAGLAKGIEKIQDGKFENWDTMIDTNIKGLLNVSRVIIPGMIERGSGHVINLSSIAGHQVYPGGSVYCATKYAVNALTQAMLIDLVNTPVKVSAVSPGMVETEFSIVRFDGDKERAKSVYAGLDPLTAEDIAETVLFCATRPAHVNINDIIIMASNQASSMVVHRNK